VRGILYLRFIPAIELFPDLGFPRCIFLIFAPDTCTVDRIDDRMIITDDHGSGCCMRARMYCMLQYVYVDGWYGTVCVSVLKDIGFSKYCRFFGGNRSLTGSAVWLASGDGHRRTGTSP
jgi:hypothetical protein